MLTVFVNWESGLPFDVFTHAAAMRLLNFDPERVAMFTLVRGGRL
jgi:hypothetical protein